MSTEKASISKIYLERDMDYYFYDSIEKVNAKAFGMFCKMIGEHWGMHNTLLGFAMDHGCHEIDDDCGSHGLDIDEDLNITHFYKIFPQTK